MKKVLLVLTLAVACMFKGYNQQLFVPGGFSSSGIGSSPNSNVGIGQTTPQSKLDVNGNIQISNATVPMGLMTEVGGTTPLLNMSVNFREPNKNTSYIGGAFRIDTRNSSTAPLFQWLARPSGTDNIIMALNSSGNLAIGKTTASYKLDVAGDINFTGNLLQNGVAFTGNSLWTKDASNNISYSGGNVSVQNGNLSLTNEGTCGVHIYNNYMDWDIEAYRDMEFGGLFIKKQGNVITSFYRDGGVRFSTGVLQLTDQITGYGASTMPNTILTLSSSNNAIIEYTDNVNSKDIFLLNKNGNLFVDGKITSKEVEIKLNVWADYVFEKNYKLMPLTQLRSYINQNNHLPNIPSASEVKEKNVNVGEMQAKLLEKIEELTLYILEQEKRIKTLETQVSTTSKN